MKYFFIILFLLLPSVGFSQSKKNLESVEKYLNSITSMSANFVQTASNGNVSEGKIKISKPNKIWMEYKDPTSVLIVGDGDFIVYYDKELDQKTHIDYEDIPASLILANDVKIDNKNLLVKDFYQDAGTTSVSLEYAKNNDIGPIKLLFSNSPMELKQWSIVDPQGIEIVVSLYDVVKGVDFEDDTFKFEDNKKPKYKK